VNTPANDLAEREYVEISPARRAALIAGARDVSPVNGLTHNHYKYPARFSPNLVRAAIEAFTKPGDLVADPFLGGGTTAVEALALGRDCLGVDISSLAVFVSEVKTLVLNESEEDELRAWAMSAPDAINMASHTVYFATGAHEGYYRNIESKKFWRLRKAVEQALASALKLSGKAEQLARCAVLRTAQWALDGRVKLPTVDEFRRMLALNALSVIEGSVAFRSAVTHAAHSGRGLYLNRSAAGIEEVPEVAAAGAPRLVLTSPPYPGIHVLYHRWQVDGRRETPAPFLIANKLDGSGESYYTLGNRRLPGLTTYWENLQSILKSATKLSDAETVFVQVVAFADPQWQLPRYLEVCEEVGLREQFLPEGDGPDGRLWREVPNRRWYADQKGSIPASQEVVLFHRLKPAPSTPLPHRRRSSAPRAGLQGA
jgi:hypothetical protein